MANIWDVDGVDDDADEEEAGEVAEPDEEESVDLPAQPAPEDDGTSAAAEVEGVETTAAPEADAGTPADDETTVATPGVIEGDEWERLRTREVKTVVNGEESKVSLNELVANHQLRKHADRQLEAIASERKTAAATTKRVGELEESIKELKVWSKDLFTPQNVARAMDTIGAGDVFRQAVRLEVEEQLRRSELTDAQLALEDEERRIIALRENTETQRAAWERERNQTEATRHKQQLIGWVNGALAGVGVDVTASPSLDRRARQLVAAELEQVFARGGQIDETLVGEIAKQVTDDLRLLNAPATAKEKGVAEAESTAAKATPPRIQEGTASKGVERKKRRRSRSLDEVFKEHYDAYEEMAPKDRMRF